MYADLISDLREEAEWAEANEWETPIMLSDHLKQAINAIEAQDRHILTLQHEMMAEAESHIAEVNRLNKQIEKLQANVRPVVRGKWLPDYDFADYNFDGLKPQKYQDGWKCSLCGQYIPSPTSYCPNCGADMREQPKGE